MDEDRVPGGIGLPSPAPTENKFGMWSAIVSVGFGVVLGTIISAVGTGIHAGELGAARRQATAIESIAQSLERPCGERR